MTLCNYSAVRRCVFAIVALTSGAGVVGCYMWRAWGVAALVLYYAGNITAIERRCGGVVVLLPVAPSRSRSCN